MSKTIVISNQSLLDIAVQTYGSVQAAFDIAYVNGLSVTAVLEPGTELKLPESIYTDVDVVQYFKGNGLNIATLGKGSAITGFNFVSTHTQTPPTRCVVITSQSLLDIAVQEFGSIQAAFDIAYVNGLSVTAVLEPGTELKLPESIYTDVDVAQYFKGSGLNIATLGEGLAITGFNFVSTHTQTPPTRCVVITSQSLLDIAVQEFGSIQAAFDIAYVNGLSVTAVLEPGTELKLPESIYTDVDVAQYFKGSGLNIATRTTEEVTPPVIQLDYLLPNILPMSL